MSNLQRGFKEEKKKKNSSSKKVPATGAGGAMKQMMEMMSTDSCFSNVSVTQASDFSRASFPWNH